MDIKVDEEAGSKASELEVGDDLRGVDWAELVDGFEFNENFILDDQVGAETAIEGEVFVADGDFFLSRHGKTSIGEFKCEAFLINRFE